MHKYCIELAEQHSIEVDSTKTGIHGKVCDIHVYLHMMYKV